jgi:starvation-inducible DNA-binding protein
MNKNGQVRFYTTRIDLTLEVRSQVVELLNQSLATTTDLKTQVKQAHWNVKGMNFYQLHELFDGIASDLEAYIAPLFMEVMPKVISTIHF